MITVNTLRKLKFNPTLVGRYLEFVAPALQQVVGENGQYRLVTETEPLVLDNAQYADELDDDEDDGEADDASLEDDEIDSDEAPKPSKPLPKKKAGTRG